MWHRDKTLIFNNPWRWFKGPGPTFALQGSFLRHWWRSLSRKIIPNKKKTKNNLSMIAGMNSQFSPVFTSSCKTQNSVWINHGWDSVPAMFLWHKWRLIHMFTTFISNLERENQPGETFKCRLTDFLESRWMHFKMLFQNNMAKKFSDWRYFRGVLWLLSNPQRKMWTWFYRQSPSNQPASKC